MKKVLLLLVLVAIAGVAYFQWKPSPEPAFSLEEGYHYLYDGKTLAGWRSVGGDSTYEAEGEDIVGRHGAGDNTFLRTDKTYGDFSLKMQMRWDEPGNSGVMFRANQRGGDGRVYGYQFELDDSDRSWSGGIYDEARRGWVADLENKPEARAAIRRDDWNDIEIEARGARIKTIGTNARQEIEKLLGQKVFLELWVKVIPGWTGDPNEARRLATEVEQS